MHACVCVCVVSVSVLKQRDRDRERAYNTVVKTTLLNLRQSGHYCETRKHRCTSSRVCRQPEAGCFHTHCRECEREIERD